MRNACKAVIVSCYYGQTTGIQCACNALTAMCWARVHKLSRWRVCDPDHVLDIGDDLYKTLGLHWYLDESDLPDQIILEGYLCHVNKLYLHDGKEVIGRRLLLNLFQNMNAALLFINSIVTAIICVSRAYYFFDSHSRDTRGLAVSDGSSVLLKFWNIQQVKNYIQVARLEFQGRQWQYFQLQFINVEIDDVEDAIVNINRNIRRLQRKHPFLRGKNLSNAPTNMKQWKTKYFSWK